ncbi:MAG: efflux transporter outer membrane subunit [Rhodocyclaceae bacterium]
MMLKNALVTALATMTLGGCATLAPDFQRPDAPVPQTWATQPEEGSARPLADVGWQTYYTDLRLRELIAQSLEHNRDLRVAALTIEQARAQYQVQRASLSPSLEAGAQQSAQRVPGDLNASGNSTTSRQYSANVGFSAYELDFFGRVRSLNEEALARFLATEEAHRSARNSLIAEVANAWLRYAANSELLELARGTLETREKSLDLTRRSFEGGVVSALDLSQSETSMLRARADVARQAVLVVQARNALELLVGGSVAEAHLPLRIEDALAGVIEVAPGIPSEVLATRPDVLAAEQELRAANANIGAARAAFFPRIVLTATAGTASASLDGLFGSGSGAWSFIPQISLPIFDGGRREANLEVAITARDIALARYEFAIQSAFREVADALAERANLVDQLDAQRNLLRAAEENHRLSDARYRSGLDSFLGLLDAQRTLYSAEQELISTRLTDAANRVALFKLLGGGWQE